MNRTLIYYSLIYLIIFSSCEDTYIPKIDAQENVIVVDARIAIGQNKNQIYLANSLSFNENAGSYETVKNASVFLIDHNNNEYILNETKQATFEIDFPLNIDSQYKIRIEYESKIYESGFESVPETPELDSVYGIPSVRDIKISGNNDVDDFVKSSGLLLYGDMSSKNSSPGFRFTARKIKQYSYEVPLGPNLNEIVYAWRSFFPLEAFNIAELPAYSESKKIEKHPLFFLENIRFETQEEKFWGWILIMKQYSLSESAYTFYKDLNNQLEPNGKLFAPVFVQARNNLKCINDPDQNILGQFEISSVREYRYYIRYISKELGFEVKEIPYFYEIPFDGKERVTPPDFWETPSKIYPNE